MSILCCFVGKYTLYKQMKTLHSKCCEECIVENENLEFCSFDVVILFESSLTRHPILYVCDTM